MLSDVEEGDNLMLTKLTPVTTLIDTSVATSDVSTSDLKF